MDYIIRIENFEGPFELLMDLIKKRKMSIHDLHISQITNDFIQSLHEMTNNNIEITSNFMEMASILLEIKSKMLLPVEKEKGDPRELLVQQLLDFQEYKESIDKLRELKTIEQTFFKRQRIEKVKVNKMGNREKLMKTYLNILGKKFREKFTPLDTLTEELARYKYTIEDRIDSLKNILEKKEICVETFFDEMESKEEMVVTFGALLELGKIQYIDILIRDNGDVLIKKREDVTNG